jgi:hypothetical protein
MVKIQRMTRDMFVQDDDSLTNNMAAEREDQIWGVLLAVIDKIIVEVEDDGSILVKEKDMPAVVGVLMQMNITGYIMKTVEEPKKLRSEIYEDLLAEGFSSDEAWEKIAQMDFADDIEEYNRELEREYNDTLENAPWNKGIESDEDYADRF